MGITLSEKHGANPSISLCFFCGEDKGIVLAGRLPKDEQAPRKAIWDLEPCDKCNELMEQGIILLGITDSDYENQSENPCRTGQFLVVKEEFAKKCGIDTKATRWAFIPESIAKEYTKQFEELKNET